MTRSLYAWASGWDVPLVDLNNIEAEVQTHFGNWPVLRSLTEFIWSPPIDPWPNRIMTLDKRLASEGDLNHYIEVTEPEDAYQYQLDTYLSGGADIDAPITFYGRQKGRAGSDKWKRFNCLLVYPASTGEDGDLQYLGNGVVFVRWRLNALEPLEEP